MAESEQLGSSARLLRLMAAAAALHAAAPAVAETRVSVRGSEYDERPLREAPVDGSDERYTVRKQQFELSHERDERDAVSLRLTREWMSGSSPWFNVPGENGAVQQVMSGATIDDRRAELVASWTRRTDGRSRTLQVSTSDENDYRSLALGLSYERPIDDRFTVGYGAGVSSDTIEPTDAALFGRVERERKRSYSAHASLAQILDSNRVVQWGLSLNHGNGYLSDPYKLFFAGGRTLPDTRPEQRTQLSAHTRYRHSVVSHSAVLHADARLSNDSWGLQSLAIEGAWYQSLGDDWRIVPQLRYYEQSAASFYAPFSANIASAGRVHSSDFRLGAFGAISGAIDLRWQSRDFAVVFGYEYYRGDEPLFFSSDNDDPAWLTFGQWHAGIDYRF